MHKHSLKYQRDNIRENMSRVLIITLWDFKKDSFQRVHPLVEYLKPKFSEITVSYKRGNSSSSLLSFIKDSFLMNGTIKREKNVTLIEVNPFLNYSHGLGTEISRTSDLNEDQLNFLAKLLSYCGSVRDFVLIISMFIYLLYKLRGKFDICICLGVWENAIGYLLKKVRKVSFQVYDDKDYEPGFQIVRLRRLYTEWLECYLLRRADLVTCVGNKLAELRTLQSGKDVFVVHNGVNYNLFHSVMGRKAHPPTLIYMGEINYFSGLDFVMEALPKLKSTIKQIRLFIIGKGSPSYTTELKNLAMRKGIEADVIFVGSINHSDLPEFLNESDIGLACFKPINWRKYAFPIKVIEYMAAGLPVIGTVGTEVEWILKTYNCGESINLNKEELTRSIASLFKNKDKYNKFSLNAKQYSKNFDWNIIMEQNYKYIINSFSGSHK